MFIQSFQSNIFFLVVLNIIILGLFIIGELWYHQKLLFLFPRYFIKWKEYKSEGKEYHLTSQEKYVVKLFGNQLIIVCLFIYIVIFSSLYLFGIFKLKYFIFASLICLMFIVYHYFFNKIYN